MLEGSSDSRRMFSLKMVALGKTPQIPDGLAEEAPLACSIIEACVVVNVQRMHSFDAIMESLQTEGGCTRASSRVGTRIRGSRADSATSAARRFSRKPKMKRRCWRELKEAYSLLAMAGSRRRANKGSSVVGSP